MAGLESYYYAPEVEDHLNVYNIRNVPARRLPPRDLNIKPMIVHSDLQEDEANEEYSV